VSETRDILQQRLTRVEERIRAACDRAGRDRSDVTLLAVTKTVDIEVATIIASLGVLDLGENRPQELWRKAHAIRSLSPGTPGERAGGRGNAAPDASRPLTPDPSPRSTGERGDAICWHLIGHLQRNKIERTLPLLSRVHSVDSLRLLEALDAEAIKQQRIVPVFLEINASGEANKTGLPAAELTNIVPHLAALKQVRVEGLMTMAAYEEDAEKCRPTFVALRQLRDRWGKELPAPHCLTHLSMGMSNDFEVAIEEGSTFVRLGTVLFEGLEA